MMEKIKTFLTETEIVEINGLKHQRVNYLEVNELKKILEKNGKKLSVKGWENNNNVYDIYFNKHKDSIEENKLSKDYKKQNPSISSSNWERFLFGMFFGQIDPEGFRIYKISELLNLEENRDIIERRLKEIGIKNFDIETFFLNKDFDFSPYTIKCINTNQIDNISNLGFNVLNFFDGFTEGLDESTKEILKNNFSEVINFVMVNVNKQDIKDKNSNYRDLLTFILNKENQ